MLTLSSNLKSRSQSRSRSRSLSWSIYYVIEIHLQPCARWPRLPPTSVTESPLLPVVASELQAHCGWPKTVCSGHVYSHKHLLLDQSHATLTGGAFEKKCSQWSRPLVCCSAQEKKTIIPWMLLVRKMVSSANSFGQLQDLCDKMHSLVGVCRIRPWPQTGTCEEKGTTAPRKH
jgi:hypothetical protein